jgi:hypothetical protein
MRKCYKTAQAMPTAALQAEVHVHGSLSESPKESLSEKGKPE